MSGGDEDGARGEAFVFGFCVDVWDFALWDAACWVDCTAMGCSADN